MHGNTGSIKNWSSGAQSYLALGYDFFIFDYRGFGKSGGVISNESQFFNDAQIVYDSISKNYKKQNINIVGYSVGTGVATKLAANNSPENLILLAPYYSMTDLMQSIMILKRIIFIGRN